MNFWYTWQINYLLLLQNFREVTGGIFDNFFLFVTHGGETIIPSALIAIIYWCINTEFASFILLNLGISTFISDLIKNIACIYRPWVLDSRIAPVPEALKMAGGYSFPSGHTQNAVSIWGSIAYKTKNKFFVALLILFILLIGFSRNYLGVHTPQDVIVSLILATAVIFWVPKLLQWIKNGKNRDIWVYLSAVLALIVCLVFEHFKSYPMDYVDGQLLVSPNEMRMSAFPKFGLFLGIFTGLFLNHRFIHFDGSKGSLLQKIIISVIGIPVFYLIYFNFCEFLLNYIEKKYAWFISSFSVIFFATVIYPIIIIFVRKFIAGKNKE